MLFNVPQYIEVEDKIAGPFTVKQLLWMFGMGAVLLIMWGFLDKTTFYISAIPVAIIFCALAFYKPYGQPLIKFVIWGFSFAFSPKFYIWKRKYEQKKKQKNVEKNEENEAKEKYEKREKILLENIEGLSKTLDTEGKERSEKIMEIISQNRKTNKSKF